MKSRLLFYFVLFVAIDCDCQSACEFWDRGNAQFDSGNYKKAIIEYNTSIAKAPNFVEAYFNRAGAQLELKDYQGAIVDYDAVIKLHSTYKEAYCLRGFAKSKLNIHLAAMEDFNTAIHIDHKYAEAYYYRGLEKILLTQLKNGCLDLKKANELGYVNAAEVLRVNCNSEGSLKSDGYTGPSADEFYKRGINILERFGLKRDLKQAVEEFNNAIDLNPLFIDAYMARAKVQAEMKDFQGALMDYTRIIEINPKYLKAYMKRAYIKLILDKESGEKDHSSALADFDKTVELDPKNFQSYLTRASFKSYYLQDSHGAIADYDKVIQLNPKHIDAYTSRGKEKITIGKTREGCLDLQYAAELKDYWAIEFYKEKCK